MKTRKISSVLAVLCMLSLFTATAFAASDNILSGNIKEADGTTGQDTNTGSGVKTGHIQDGAVTTGKIVDGAVTDAKITGLVSGSKLGTHSHNGSDISTGTIPVERLSTYKNVKVVHKGNIDGIQTFNTISAALSSITDATQDNPYVILVMPGVYVDNIVTKDFVSIVGTNKDAVKVTSNSSMNEQGTISIVTGNSPIERLTIENTDPFNAVAVNASLSPNAIINDCNIVAKNNGSYAYGILAGGLISVKRSDIQAISSGTSNAAIATSTGGPVVGGGFEDCRLTAQGDAYVMGFQVSNYREYDVINCYITAKGSATDKSNILAVRSFSSVVKARNSVLNGSDGLSPSVAVWSNGTFKGAHSQLIGPIQNGLGNNIIKLINCFNENFDPFL